MSFIKIVLTFVLVFPFLVIAENEPIEFGYYIKKSDIRSIGRQITELRNCSHPNCKWVKLKNRSDIWAIKGNAVSFAEYLEHYMKAPADSEHFFFINKNSQELIYTTLYGHQSEVTELPPESTKEAL